MHRNGYTSAAVLTVGMLLFLFIGVFFLGRLTNSNSSDKSSSQNYMPFVLFKAPGSSGNLAPKPTPEASATTGTYNGEIACMPLKNKEGSQKLLCSIGLKGEDGSNYGLINLAQQDLISGKFSNGTKVQIVGEFTPKIDDEYDIVGNIEIQNIIKVE